MQGDHILYFNDLESAYYMSSKTIELNKGNQESAEVYKGSEEVVEIKLVDTTAIVFYKNLQTKTFLCQEPALTDKLEHKSFIYEDQRALNIIWTLVDDNKVISGYDCQKAKTVFRGRSYEVWFTTEIPLPYGPWKLGGLPGLILEAYDLEQQVSFTAENITIPDHISKNKVLKPSNGTKVTHKEFVASLESKEDKIRKSILARLPKGAKFMNGETQKNVLELEYEWSKE